MSEMCGLPLDVAMALVLVGMLMGAIAGIIGMAAWFIWDASRAP